MRRRTLAVVVLCLAAAPCAHAQWFEHRASGIPRTKDGTPDLSARAPRTADGTPDLSGIWKTDATPIEELNRLFPGMSALAVPGDGPEVLNKHFLNVFAGAPPQEEPLRPETVPVLRQRALGMGKDNPTARCLPGGIPMGDLLAVPRQFVQTAALLVILYEGINPHRMVYLDGRTHPVDPQPAWLGYSVGAWQGDTLVIETRGFNDRAWLDAFGHPRSEAMRLVERLHRRDYGHIDVETTIDDPRTYTKPFTIRYTQTLVPDSAFLEYVCAENERDLAHLVGK